MWGVLYADQKAIKLGKEVSANHSDYFETAFARSYLVTQKLLCDRNNKLLVSNQREHDIMVVPYQVEKNIDSDLNIISILLKCL